MDNLLGIVGDIFGLIVVEAVVILVCFNVLLKIIELAFVLTNLQTKGGE